jgi:hypothetical protein
MMLSNDGMRRLTRSKTVLVSGYQVPGGSCMENAKVWKIGRGQCTDVEKKSICSSVEVNARVCDEIILSTPYGSQQCRVAGL